MTTATRNERIAQFKQAIENFTRVQDGAATPSDRLALQRVIEFNQTSLAKAEAEPEDPRDRLVADPRPGTCQCGHYRQYHTSDHRCLICNCTEADYDDHP